MIDFRLVGGCEDVEHGLHNYLTWGLLNSNEVAVKAMVGGLGFKVGRCRLMKRRGCMVKPWFYTENIGYCL